MNTAKSQKPKVEKVLGIDIKNLMSAEQMLKELPQSRKLMSELEYRLHQQCLKTIELANKIDQMNQEFKAADHIPNIKDMDFERFAQYVMNEHGVHKKKLMELLETPERAREDSLFVKLVLFRKYAIERIQNKGMTRKERDQYFKEQRKK